MLSIITSNFVEPVSPGTAASATAKKPSLIEPEELRPTLVPVTTDFCALPDGSMAEIVYRPTINKKQLVYLIWNKNEAMVVDHFEHDGCLYTPPMLDVRVPENLNLRLPSGVKACPAPADFFLEVSELIRSHVDVTEASIYLITAFVFSTWFIDRLAVAPYLWICCPPGSGKTTLMRLLQCLCRRSILFAGGIPSGVYSLPALLVPTLLLDEQRLRGTQFSYALESWLRAGNARGTPVTVGGEAYDAFGAKVLCSRQPASDRALSSRCLHISMVPTCKNLQPIDDETAERIAGDFLPRLLQFRLEHYGEFRPTDADLSLLSPRIRDLVRALVLPFVGVGGVIESILQAMRDQEQQAVIDGADEPEALVILALFEYSHDKEFSTVLVGQIASRINARRDELGEDATLTARAVGSILKSLGFVTDKLDRFGRGLHLTYCDETKNSSTYV